MIIEKSEKSYKDTLNLPHTDFPMKANLAQRELEFLAQWQEIDLYAQISQKRQGAKKFILHDGPPYANGNIHIGHAVNKILKDMVVKSKSLSGFDSPFVPGWDCHGLPIEHNIEKKFGKPGVKISADEFRKACREYAQQQVNIQREEFKRLGILADWENPYLTMDFKFEANIVRGLAKILEKGHIQKGSKPVHWCMECASALAEAEVEYENKKSSAIDIRFRVIDAAQLAERFKISPFSKGGISIPVWTTTPWTLPANEAVALSADQTYSLLQVKTQQGTEYLVLPPVLFEAVLLRYGITEYKELGHCLGHALEGLQLQHPFYNRTVPVVMGEHVTMDAGTGAVHTAPAHGQDDYIVAKKYNLPINNPVGGNGCFLPDTELFAGLHVLKANDQVIEVLKQHNNLLHAETIEHSYPHCWRHKTPLIFRATPQWFISMDQNHLRETAEKAITDVSWIPTWGQERILGMISDRPDWCISRQRTWGVPIPLFIHKQTNELHPETAELIETIAKQIEQKGVEAWFELDPKTLGITDDYIKSTDTLDVWFDSGVTHECVLSQRPELKFPADLYLEGSDQHRGWFQSSLLTSSAIRGTAPYKAVLTHGFTVDTKGRKMSKSLGNVIAPEQVIKNLGADVLRLWVASTDYRGEIAVSDEILKRTSDVYRRLRNTARFLLANLSGFDPEKDSVPVDQMLALDRWIMERAQHLQAEILKAYDEYQFHIIYQKVHNFCSIDLGGFYLDIIKDRQYTTQANGLSRRSAQTAMYHIAEALVRWLAPILSFTAEEIWKYLPGQREPSVFLNTWYDRFPVSKNVVGPTYAEWELIITIREAVNKELEKQRNEGCIGSSLDAEVIIHCSDPAFSALAKLGDELRFVLITSYAKVERSNSDTMVITVKPSAYTKCIRCWHHREDVGSHAEHPELCGRCIENVDGKGEARLWA
jgi:isoleucyl-tRNA synthetase